MHLLGGASFVDIEMSQGGPMDGGRHPGTGHVARGNIHGGARMAPQYRASQHGNGGGTSVNMVLAVATTHAGGRTRGV